MFSEVNQTPVNLCALRAARIASASKQKAHHGRRGGRPFGALNVVGNGRTGPATGRRRHDASCIDFGLRTNRHQHTSTVAVAAVALAACISVVSFHTFCCVAADGVNLCCVLGLMRGIAGAVRIRAARHQSQPCHQHITDEFFHSPDCTSRISSFKHMPLKTCGFSADLTSSLTAELQQTQAIGHHQQAGTHVGKHSHPHGGITKNRPHKKHRFNC